MALIRLLLRAKELTTVCLNYLLLEGPICFGFKDIGGEYDNLTLY